MPNRRNKRKNAKKQTDANTPSQSSTPASTLTDQQSFNTTSNNLGSTDPITETAVMSDTLRDNTNTINNTEMTAENMDNAAPTATSNDKPATQLNSSSTPAHYEIPAAGPVGVGALGGTTTGAAVAAAHVAETDGAAGLGAQQPMPLSDNVKHSIQSAIAARSIDTENIIKTVSNNVQSGAYADRSHPATTTAPAQSTGTTHKGATAMAGGVVGAAGAVGAAGIAANATNNNEIRGSVNTNGTNAESKAMGGAKAFGSTSPINTTAAIHPTDTTNAPTGPNPTTFGNSGYTNAANTDGFNPNASTSEGMSNERRRSSGRSGRSGRVPIPAELIGGTPNCAPPAVATNSSSVVGSDVDEGQAFDPVRRLSNGFSSAVTGAANTVTTGGRRLSETVQDKVLPKRNSRKGSGEADATAATTGGMTAKQQTTTTTPIANGQAATLATDRSAEGGHNASKKKNCIIL